MYVYEYADEEEDMGEYLKVFFEDKMEEGSGWWEVSEWAHSAFLQAFAPLCFVRWFFRSGLIDAGCLRSDEKADQEGTIPFMRQLLNLSASAGDVRDIINDTLMISTTTLGNIVAKTEKYVTMISIFLAH